MKLSRIRHNFGFSLVEVTLALGIVTIAILSTMGLLAVGLEMNRDSVANTKAASLAREIAIDMRLLNDWNVASPSASRRFQIVPIPLGTTTPSTMFVNEDGSYIKAATATNQQRSDALFRVDVTFGTASGSLPPSVRVLISWPSPAAGIGTWPAQACSKYEIVTSLSPL